MNDLDAMSDEELKQEFLSVFAKLPPEQARAINALLESLPAEIDEPGGLQLVADRE